MEIGAPSGAAKMALGLVPAALSNRVGQGVFPHPLAPLKLPVARGARHQDSVVSPAGFVQPFDRVCIELKARGAHDFVELCK